MLNSLTIIRQIKNVSSELEEVLIQMERISPVANVHALEMRMETLVKSMQELTDNIKQQVNNIKYQTDNMKNLVEDVVFKNIMIIEKDTSDYEITKDSGTTKQMLHTLKPYLQARLRVTREVNQDMEEISLPQVMEAAVLIVDSLKNGGKLLICGNGGSAADSQHVAAELMSKMNKAIERPALAAVALTTDTSIITAYANDTNFEGVFARQVEGLGSPGDVLLGISTSGNSTNVGLAIAKARQKNMKTIGLFGAGAKLGKQVDVKIIIPHKNTQTVQENMLPLEHLLCETVEALMYPEVISHLSI